MTHRLRALLFVLLTALLYAAVPIYFDRTGMYHVTGDEPHYIINGLSIARDGDLKLDNNYREWTAFAIGPMFPHAYSTADGWYPFRGLGVPLIVAWPADWFGPVGARVALALLMALLCWPVYRVALHTLGDQNWALALSGGFLWALPFLVCAGLVFPDTITGALTFSALAAILLRRDAKWNASSRIAFALATSMICLVYWRHLPVLGVLALAFLAQSLHLHGVRSFAEFDLRRLLRLPTVRADLAVLVTLTLTVAATTAYILLYKLTSRGDGFFYITPVWAWVEPFVGHHLDQNHGILWRNPLLWLALPGWYLLWRQNRALVVLIAALYLVLFIPQCITDMKYGAHGIGGRYSWNFIWLWFLPLCASANWLRETHAGRQFLAISLGVGALIQIVMAVRWLSPETGELLLMATAPKVAFETNIFAELRWLLPWFNLEGSSFRNPLNAWWMAMVALALATVPLTRLLRTRPSAQIAAACLLVLSGVLASLWGLNRSFDEQEWRFGVNAIYTEFPVKEGAITRPTGASGYVGYAMVLRLPPGRYRVSYSYLAPLGGAAWELRRAIRMGTTHRIDTGPLASTSELTRNGFENSKTEFEFNVGNGDLWPIAGFNLWSDGSGPVSLSGITITRLGPPTGPSGQPQD